MDVSELLAEQLFECVIHFVLASSEVADQDSLRVAFRLHRGWHGHPGLLKLGL